MHSQTHSSRYGRLTIISCAPTQATDARLAALARFCGLTPTGSESLGGEPDLECDALIASFAAFAQLTHAARSQILDEERLVLLYAQEQQGCAAPDNLVGALTQGALRGPSAISSSPLRVTLAQEMPPGCRQLRGLSFEIVPDQAGWRAFVPQVGSPALEPVVTLGGSPWLVRVRRAQGDLFLLAGGRALDLDAACSAAGIQPLQYLELLPWLIFMRTAGGEACWHNPNPRACLLIDDPLLRPRYGYLDYHQLALAMDEHRFATSIAFIPWNYRRSQPRVAALFHRRPGQFSLCVHGCDHTAGEFKRGSVADLRDKSRLAQTWMAAHRDATGIEHEPIMIFPQGGFIKAALQALDAEGYKAAINTSVLAADWQVGDLTWRDLLEVAVTAYGGCPLFARWYPRDLFAIAFGVFVGKPAFVVEHHGYFKAGCEPLAAFVTRLSQQIEQLEWDSPGEIVNGAALIKCAGPHERWLRFYTDDFVFKNSSSQAATYRLYRRLTNGEPTGLIHDNRPLDFELQGNDLVAQLTTEPGQRVRIRLLRAKEPAWGPGPRRPPWYRAQVASRRLLSELRDNYLSRSPWLLGQAKGLSAILQRAAGL
ncbi:MAG TPA: hypothetical protein VKV28_07470 [Candidatus Binataceae bacterium]|nr:hypothetical protein [Candidatus Binataceae bacterium]